MQGMPRSGSGLSKTLLPHGNTGKIKKTINRKEVKLKNEIPL